MTTNAILATESLQAMPHRQPKTAVASSASAPAASPRDGSKRSNNELWKAVLARDAARDGEFVFAVSSTGVYCRPSCAARRPRRENVKFFQGPEQAEHAGYRACLRCRPRSISANSQADSVKATCRFIEQHLDEPLTLQRLGKE